MKRNLRNTVYVTRGYSKNNQPLHKNIYYTGEDYKVEIHKFDRNFDKIYDLDSLNKSTNLSQKSWRNLKVLYSSDKKDTTIDFDYNCTETGNYLVDLLYYDYNYDDKKCSGTLYLKTDNGGYVEKKMNTFWVGDDNNLNRNTQQFEFRKDKKYNIKYKFNKNVAIIGVIIQKFDTYYGTRYNEGDLTIESISGKISENMTPNEATVKIWYNHELDDESNLSGYLFDFRDEINIYKKDPTDKEFVQIYGGYISTVSVDEKNLIMTLSCADRLIDGENRYCMQEIVTLGGEKNEKAINDYSKDSYTSYDNRGKILDYLTNIYELPLNNSKIADDNYFKKQFPKGYKFSYTKNSSPKTSFTNMSGTQEKNYMVLRNGAQRYDDYNTYDNKGNKPQTGVILDCTTLNTAIRINDAPNFYIKYGLGEEEKSITKAEYEKSKKKSK